MLQKIQKSKLGFTLIEMLVVIAIVAILVSVIMPMATSSTLKASAATNAANLRAVEAAVATMYFENPEKFVNGDIATGITGEIEEAIRKIDEEIASSWFPISAATREFMINVATGTLQKILNSITTETFYAKDGVLTFDDLTVKAPGSKAIVIGSFTVRKDINMAVTIADGAVIATYDGMPSGCFAAIADTGNSTDTSILEHSFRDTNNDGVCDICGPDHDKDWDDDIMNDAEQDYGGVHQCDSTDGDHTCDKSGCHQTVACRDEDENCVCDVGKETLTHTVKKNWYGKVTCCGHAEGAACHQ